MFLINYQSEIKYVYVAKIKQRHFLIFYIYLFVRTTFRNGLTNFDETFIYE